MDIRILLYENVAGGQPSLAPALEALGATVACCRDRMCLLEQLLGFRPRLIAYALEAGSPADRSMLEMLRRLAPGVPLVILTDERTPETRRIENDLRPLWLGTREELAGLPERVRDAFSRPRRAAP